MKGFHITKLLLPLLLLLSGCFWFDENEQHFVVGKYFTETSADTRTALYFDNSKAPLVENVSAIGSTTEYLAVRDGAHYYLFGRSASSDSVARKTAIGPLQEHMFHLKLKQLIGDSTLRLSATF